MVADCRGAAFCRLPILYFGKICKPGDGPQEPRRIVHPTGVGAGLARLSADSFPIADDQFRAAGGIGPAGGETPCLSDWRCGKEFDWRVSVVQSDQINAFCLPGGKIIVYTGILPVANTESALATVLGHEMAHATSRHGAQRALEQNLTQTAMIGVAGSLSDMDYEKQRAILGAFGAGAQYGVLMPFSRSHESEADHIRLIYMARAGYDPRESIAFWKRMEHTNSAQPPQFLSDHPSHGIRIQQLENWMPQAMEEYNRAQAH